MPAQSGVCPVLDACRLLLALPAASSIHKLIPTAASRRPGGRTSHVMGSSCSRRLPPPTDAPWLLRARYGHLDPCATQPLNKWQRISERKGAFDQGAPPRPAAGAAGVGYQDDDGGHAPKEEQSGRLDVVVLAWSESESDPLHLQAWCPRAKPGVHTYT